MSRIRTTPLAPCLSYSMYYYYYPAKLLWYYSPIYEYSIAVPGGKSITDIKWVRPLDKKKTWRSDLKFNDVEIVNTLDSLAGDSTKYDFVAKDSVGRTWYRTFSTYYLHYSLGNPVPPTFQEIPDSLLGAAFRDLQPNYDSFGIDGINIYTLILELADLKKTFTKSAFALKKKFSDIPEKNLLINFGILPFFSDLQAIYDIVVKLDTAIEKWNEAAAKGATWDLHLDVAGLPASYSTGYQTTTLTDSINGFHRSITTWGKYSASGKVHLYFKPKPIDPELYSSIRNQALGFDRPLLGVWEAVPFSWAVDYFFHVDKIIADYDEALPSLFTYEYVDAGYSLKQEAQGDMYVTFTAYNGSWKGISPTEVWIPRSITKKSYIRRAVSQQAMFDYMSRPSDYQLGWDKGWRQASYLASVAYLMKSSRK